MSMSGPSLLIESTDSMIMFNMQALIDYNYYTYGCSFTDINECIDNVTLCDHICVNTDGSYFCSCMDGYVLKKGTNMCIGKQSAFILLSLCLVIW